MVIRQLPRKSAALRLCRSPAPFPLPAQGIGGVRSSHRRAGPGRTEEAGGRSPEPRKARSSPKGWMRPESVSPLLRALMESPDFALKKAPSPGIMALKEPRYGEVPL
jgi:hypothetical protein